MPAPQDTSNKETAKRCEVIKKPFHMLSFKLQLKVVQQAILLPTHHTARDVPHRPSPRRNRWIWTAREDPMLRRRFLPNNASDKISLTPLQQGRLCRNLSHETEVLSGQLSLDECDDMDMP